jgi:hypothetical protein
MACSSLPSIRYHSFWVSTSATGNICQKQVTRILLGGGISCLTVLTVWQSNITYGNCSIRDSKRWNKLNILNNPTAFTQLSFVSLTHISLTMYQSSSACVWLCYLLCRTLFNLSIFLAQFGSVTGKNQTVSIQSYIHNHQNTNFTLFGMHVNTHQSIKTHLQFT